MNSKPVDTPLDPSLSLILATPNNKLCHQKMYQKHTGSLNHLTMTSCPDIAFAMSKLCQFNSNLMHIHFKAAKWVLRYVIHTHHYSLKYGCGTDKDHELKFISYTDSDYSSNLINRKSTMGYVFVFNKGPISWSSRKQPTVAMCTMASSRFNSQTSVPDVLHYRNGNFNHPTNRYIFRQPSGNCSGRRTGRLSTSKAY